jgi:hypothetical protein
MVSGQYFFELYQTIIYLTTLCYTYEKDEFLCRTMDEYSWKRKSSQTAQSQSSRQIALTGQWVKQVHGE